MALDRGCEDHDAALGNTVLGFQGRQWVGDLPSAKAVRFIDDPRAPDHPREQTGAGRLHEPLHFADGFFGQILGVDLFRISGACNGLANESGNRRLPRAGLAGDEVGAPAQRIAGQKCLELANDLVLADYFIPAIRTVAFGELHGLFPGCFPPLSGLFQTRWRVARVRRRTSANLEARASTRPAAPNSAVVSGLFPGCFRAFSSVFFSEK